MSLKSFNKNRLFGIKESRPTRNYNRLYKSPHFSFKNANTIASNGFLLFDYLEDNLTTKKYGSFNNLHFSNNSDEDYLIYPNQDRSNGIIVPSKTEKTFDSTIIPSTTSLLIENIGAGTTSANEIRIIVWKDLTEVSELISRIHRNAFGLNDDTQGLDKIRQFLRDNKKGAI